MSDSSLSELEGGYESYDTHNELTLPTLPAPIQHDTPIRHDNNHIPTLLRLQPPALGPMLPPTTSILFTKLLYSRLILDSNPPTVKITCLQPGCGYSPTPQLINQTSTGNLWKHYTQKHLTIAYTTKGQKNILSSPLSSTSSFFKPWSQRLQPIQSSNSRAKYRELLLSFVISNNLSLRLIESHSFHQLVQFLSPTTLSVSS